MKKISFLLLLFFMVHSTIFSAEARQTPSTHSGNKIFISPLRNITQVHPENYHFYSAALARSIKNTLSRNITADYIESVPDDAELLSKGYQYQVAGSYAITGTEIKIEFSVTHIERKITTILAQVSGYADNRVFDLIDKISERVAQAVVKPLPAVVTAATVININREGQITTRAEVLNSADLRNRYFSGRDLRGRNLSNSNFSGSYFEGTNLSAANLSGSHFSHTRMEGANLQGSNARGANFNGADMRGTKLKGAQFTGARFENTHFGNIDLTRESPEFQDAVLINPLFDKRKMYLGLSVNIGLNMYDKSAYAVNVYYDNVTGKQAHIARSITAEFYYFFNENWGIKFSAGWRELEVNVNEWGYDISETTPLNLDMKTKSSYLIFELSAVFRMKSFFIFAGFYAGILLKFSGFMYVLYEADLFTVSEANADNSFGNKMLFGLTFGGGYTLRLSRMFSLLFSLNFQIDITKWFSDAALNAFKSDEPSSYGGSALKNHRQFCIFLRISLLWGLM